MVKTIKNTSDCKILAENLKNNKKFKILVDYYGEDFGLNLLKSSEIYFFKTATILNHERSLKGKNFIVISGNISAHYKKPWN